MKKLKQMAENLSNLTVLEAKKLVEVLKNDYGIEPASNVVYEKPVIEVIEEVQSQYDVILKSIGTASKLNAVKLVKVLTSLGLRESKDLVDSAPVMIKEKITRIEADELEKQFNDIGAEVEVK